MNLQEAIQKIKTGTGSLDLELDYEKIGDSEVAQLGKAIAISKLTSLRLNLDYNQIKNVDELGKAFAVNTKLTSLELNLSSNQIKNVDELGKAFAVNTKLTLLELYLYNNQIKNVDELGKAIAVNTKLTSLTLWLHNNQIKNVDELGKAFAVNTKLTSLTLNIYNNQIKNVDELGKVFAVNTKLTSLYLYLNNNQIKNVDELGKAFAVNTKLTLLYLSLSNNQIKNVDELGKAIAVNTKLTSLKLWLNNNQIKNVDELGKAFAVNTKLTSLKLWLSNNQITNEETKILSDFIKKSSVQITLDFGNNIGEEEKKALKSALALNKDAKYREKQKARQESEQQKIVEQINNINIDTNKTKLESIEILSINSNLKDKFYKKFNEIQNQLQTKINNINTTYAKSNITILDKQAEHYGLGKNGATAKFNEIKGDKYLKFIELQDNTAIKTIFKSEECFKIFDSQNIQICLKGMDKRVTSKEKIDQCNQESDCIYQKYWIIKKDYYIQDSNNFLKICLDEFAAEQFVSCNNYDSKKAISRNVQNLDIHIQSTAIFNSEECFSIFRLGNIKMCSRGTKKQILPKSSVDPCYDPNLCMYSPSWSISTDENLSSFEDYFRVCKEEFENKNFISCDDQISSWVDWSLIIKIGFAAGVIIGGMYLCKKCLPFLAGAGQLPLEQQVGDNE